MLHAKLLLTKTHIPALSTHADHLVIEPEKEGTISIKAIRALNEWTNLKPFNKEYKIALCLNFHTATSEAQNALLKTLEEPPQNTYLWLHAVDSDAILPTIISRCEVIIGAHEQFIHPVVTWHEIDTTSRADAEITNALASYLLNPTSRVTGFTLAEQLSKLEKSELFAVLDLVLLQLYREKSLSNHAKKTRINSIFLAKEYLEQNVNSRLILEQIILSAE